MVHWFVVGTEVYGNVGEFSSHALICFPYFSGKTGVVETVWEAFGEVLNYVEVFAGSGAGPPGPVVRRQPDTGPG